MDNTLMLFNINSSNILIMASITISFLCVITSFIIWLKYGKDNEIKLISNFDKIVDLTPLEFSLIYNEKANKEAIFPSLLYLANNNYITIKEDKNGFTITKKKEYEIVGSHLDYLMKELFKKDIHIELSEFIENINKKNEIKKTELKEISNLDIPKKINKIANNLIYTVNDNNEQYFYKSGENKRNILVVMISLILILTTCIPFFETNNVLFIILSLVFSIITLFILIKYINILSLVKIRFIDILLSGSVILAIVLVFLTPVITINISYLVVYLVGALSTLIILSFYKFMPKKTTLAIEKLCEIESMLYFLEHNKDFEDTLKKNSNYFYDILPFSYILGIDDKVFKLMKEYGINQPKFWNIENFTITKFKNSLKRFDNLLKEDVK